MISEAAQVGGYKRFEVFKQRICHVYGYVAGGNGRSNFGLSVPAFCGFEIGNKTHNKVFLRLGSCRYGSQGAYYAGRIIHTPYNIEPGEVFTLPFQPYLSHGECTFVSTHECGIGRYVHKGLIGLLIDAVEKPEPELTRREIYSIPESTHIAGTQFAVLHILRAERNFYPFICWIKSQVVYWIGNPLIKCLFRKSRDIAQPKRR